MITIIVVKAICYDFFLIINFSLLPFPNPSSFRNCYSGPSQHSRARRGVREKRQYHQPDVLGKRALHASQFSGVAAGDKGGGLRFTTRSRWHQLGNREDRVRHYQPAASHQGRVVRHRQLHVPAEQREYGHRVRPRA